MGKQAARGVRVENTIIINERGNAIVMEIPATEAGKVERIQTTTLVILFQLVSKRKFSTLAEANELLHLLERIHDALVVNQACHFTRLEWESVTEAIVQTCPVLIAGQIARATTATTEAGTN